jgi:pSer/pThr/pTyr-binding forkhead associated (FHA) protein/type II secretory pathway predicted ATPase ExeA
VRQVWRIASPDKDRLEANPVESRERKATGPRFRREAKDDSPQDPRLPGCQPEDLPHDFGNTNIQTPGEGSMRIEDLGLHRQPFHARGQSVAFVRYESQQAADEFLRRVLEDKRGVGVLHGIESSGKTTIVNHFVRGLPAEIPVALINETRIETSELLATILAQFGYTVSTDSADELLNLLKKAVIQQTYAGQAPLLVLENINRLYPSGLHALGELAKLTTHQEFALRFILVGTSAGSRIIESPEMKPIRKRLVGTYELSPLTAREALKYLHAKLRTSGVTHPHRILPISTCVELHKESGGWPGELDGLTLRAIERAERLPIGREHVYPLADQSQSVGNAPSSMAGPTADTDLPKLLITVNGKLLQEFEVSQAKTLIGRARINDLVMNNQYVSKHHALLVSKNNTMFLVDLKSSNGLYVNSHRIRRTVLRHDDIIEIGNHRIKVVHPSSQVGVADVEPDVADTSIMKTVADMRRAVAKKFLRISPAKRQGMK